MVSTGLDREALRLRLFSHSRPAGPICRL